jgi:hypothetical protein
MVLLAPFRVSAVVPDPILRVDSFVIAVRFWPRGASGRFWDIGQVPSRNFD